MNSCKRMLAALSAASILAISIGVARAEGPSEVAAASEPASADGLGLEEIIVTGVATGARRKIDASFAISTLNADQIAEFAPLHTGDLFNSTPGILAENTGGETGTNTFVRGFAQSSGSGFVTVQLNGLPIYPTSVSGFIENSALFRLDESVERVEALRGGSAVLLSNAQPGVTFNFLQRKGGPNFEGIAKVTTTDYGLRRVDFLESGPLNESTFYSVGGFYRSSPGIRDAEYIGDYGGQLDLQLTHKVDGGEVNVWARHTDDHNNWYLPIPVQIGADNKSVTEFPGFPAGSGTYQGNDNRFGVIETGPNGETRALDSKDGRAVKLSILGASLERDLGGGWNLNARTGYTSGSGGLVGPVGGGNPQTLQSFIADTIAAANADPAVVAAAGGPATSAVNLRYTGTGAAITDTSIEVMPVGLWYVNLDFSAFVADLRLARTIGRNTITFGGYLSDESYQDEWSLGNNRLLTATPHGQRIDFGLDNGVTVTRDGFIGASFYSRSIAVDTRAWAAFMLDEWQVTTKLRLEAGGRYEKRNYAGNQRGIVFGADLDNNPLTLYDSGAAYLTGNYSPVSFKDDHLSWTAAANFQVAPTFSMFARASSGARFPDPDNIVNGQVLTQSIRQYEAGAKLLRSRFSLFATLFHNDFSNVPFFELINGNAVLSSSGSRASGLELEADVRPFRKFSVALLGTYVDSKLVGGGNPGKRLFRQPEFAVKVTPKCEFVVGGVGGAVYGSVTSFFGDRYSDLANEQPIAPYAQVDIGAYVKMHEQFTARVSVDNIFDELGLTERNPRASGTGVTSGLTLGRPIFGRTAQFSLEYHF